MKAANVAGVFVYGTLKRGHCRERCWPLSPQSIRIALIRGSLFTRRDYPALRPGDDAVLGELWSYPPEQMPAVLHVLDEIEQTNQPGLPDLYRRVVVSVQSLDGGELGNAYTYHYASNPLSDGFERIHSTPDQFAHWP